MLSRTIVRVLAMLAGTAVAQQPAAPVLHAIDNLQLREDGPVLRQRVLTGEPFTVAGPQGLVVGQQQGLFEAWVLPVKLLSHMTIEANVEGYDVPIDLNSMAREIEVRPDRTTITYSHIELTVRQTMFAPDEAAEGTGVVVLFQVDALHPVDLTFRFTAEMRQMWPEPNFGTASPEWVAQGATGLYLLHTDFPELAGAVALPGATHGIMAPYQERPAVYPLEFHLHVDPKTDRERVYPLLMAVGRTKETATPEVLEGKLKDLNENLAAMYAAHVAHEREQEAALTSIKTPDEGLDADFGWAVTSIGQLRAKAQPSGEMALVAGYYASGDSARPGFGWFFGRDALYTLYAVDSYGDFALSRDELSFLMRRQRADGKMMHEYSQTAAYVDWKSFPYEYAAADATPLFLTAMLDYVRSSGDVAFLRDHRDAVLKAWQFETTHDSDGDGVYDNAQGTGWVESWPPGMPRQEVYLALLDEQASAAMGQLGGLLAEGSIATEAKERAAKLHATIENEYYRADTQTYAFSRNAGGVLDTTATMFPAIAWWNGGVGLDHPEASLKAWASHDFATDWGLRDVAASDRLYDSMSYHQGSVWPLFTGWAAMAQYRSGHALAGYQSAMQNADLTNAQDIGAVTELLSGDFFVPFGRSTSHQLWSSAMVITPVMRGLFGIDVDGVQHTLTVTPHLPADWGQAAVDRLRVGDSVVNLLYKREGRAMVVQVQQVSGAAVRFAGTSKDGGVLRVPLPAFEVSIGHGLPLPGARTAQMKVLEEMTDAHSLRLELEGMAGSESVLRLRRNDGAARVQVEGAELQADTLHVHFPAGSGYVSQTVTLRW
jgi:glycogen debranching enzyme